MKRKQFLSMLLAIVLVCILGTSALAAANFSDVRPGMWFYDAVQYCVDNGMVNGTSATTFSPETSMTRAQFITILGRMEHVDAGRYINNGRFSDVKPGDYFSPYVTWAASKGLATGTSLTIFAPDGQLTREQMATFVARYLTAKNVQLSAPDMPTAYFKDAARVSGWAQESVELLPQYGLLRGDTDGNVNPGEVLTRAEGATVLTRLRTALLEVNAALDDSFAPLPQSEDETHLLARIIYAEAGAEPFDGMLAVGYVVLNRVASPSFPNTIEGVIYEADQFTPVQNGAINKTPSADALRAAQICMSGESNPVGNSLYFINPDATSNSTWLNTLRTNYTFVAKIGTHEFYA